MNEIICPYCQSDESYILDDWALDEGENEIECSSCEREFVTFMEITVSYETMRLDCSNGDHDMEPVEIDGYEADMCNHCGYMNFRSSDIFNL